MTDTEARRYAEAILKNPLFAFRHDVTAVARAYLDLLTRLETPGLTADDLDLIEQARGRHPGGISRGLVRIIDRITQPTSTAGEGTLRTTRDRRQADVIAWVRRCFGNACAEDGPERGARVVEEALELGQAAELPEDRAIHLVRHVYSKPVGKIGQEIGGVSVTLLSFAAYAGLSADEEEAREVARVLSLPVEHFKKRHLEKAADGITKHPSEYAPVTTAPAVNGVGNER